jgi:hypothetical protein
LFAELLFLLDNILIDFHVVVVLWSSLNGDRVVGDMVSAHGGVPHVWLAWGRGHRLMPGRFNRNA